MLKFQQEVEVQTCFCQYQTTNANANRKTNQKENEKKTFQTHIYVFMLVFRDFFYIQNDTFKYDSTSEVHALIVIYVLKTLRKKMGSFCLQPYLHILLFKNWVSWLFIDYIFSFIE